MEQYSIEQILDALYRAQELDRLNIQELCSLAKRPYSIKQKYYRNNITSEIIAAEYGNDMLIHIIIQAGIQNRIIHTYPPDPVNNGWLMAVAVPDNKYQEHLSYFWQFELVNVPINRIDPKKYKIL